MTRTSISTKLILTLVMIMGVGAAASSILSIQSQSQLVLDRDISREITSTSNDAEDISYFIEQVSSDVRHLSANYGFAISAVTTSAEDQLPIEYMTAATKNLLYSKPYITEVHFLDNDGVEAFALSHVEDQMRVLMHSDSQIWLKPVYWNILKDLPDGDVYATALTQDEYTSDGRLVTLEEVTGPTMMFATSVFSPNGERVGSLVSIVSGQQLLSIVEEARQRGPADVLLIDNSGVVVTGPETIETELLAGYAPGSNLYDLDPDLAEMLLEGNQSIINESSTVFTLSRIITMQSEYSDTLTLVRAVPESQLLLPVNQLRSQLIISNLAQFGFVAIAVYFLSRTLIRPLRSLRDASQAISKGNFSKRVDVGSNDEIGELGQSFNLMAERLEDYKNELETRVQQKTEQLATKLEELEESNTRLNEIKQAILNVMEDVEIARTTAEQEKAQAEAYLDSIGEGVVAIDNKGRVMLLNRSAEKMIGKTYAESYKQKIQEIVSVIGKDSKGNFMRLPNPPITMVLDKGEPVTSEYYISNDKGRIPVASTVAPIRLNEEIIGAVEVMRDVTVDKEIDMAKSEFVSMVSHQLRTPITTINWYIEMVMQNLQEMVPDEDKEYLGEIKNASTRMLELINSLLDVSRIELGTLPVTPKPTDLKELSESCLKELEHEIQAKKLKVTTEYADSIPEINVDPKLMRMMFTNLLTNAVKYTDENDEVQVRMYAQGEVEGLEGDLIYQVKDTGFGIPEDQQDRIFEKMFRADNVKDTDVNGTGLGLYIIKSMLERMGGKIWFESELGVGSTFYVQIPLKGMPKVIGSGAAVTGNGV